MKLHPIRIFYVEIGSLMIVTVFAFLAVRQIISQPQVTCEPNWPTFLPYTYRYAEELCRYRGLIETCSVYYSLAFLIIVLSQVQYLKGRQGLYIVNRKFFFSCLFILMFSCTFWAIGQPDNIGAYNFKFHTGD